MSRNKTFVRHAALLAVAAVSLATPLLAQDAAEVPVRTAPSLDVLRKEFIAPPDAAKPMVRWWWFGPAVTKPEILRELTQMKADGIGGAELAFVYAEELDDPAKDIKNLAFLSPEHLEAVTYAQAEGRKLGLRIDVTLCSGWPYGGPDTPIQQNSGSLHITEVPVAANATSAQAPALKPGDSYVSAVLANPSTAAPPAPTGRRGGGPRLPTFDAKSTQPLTISNGSVSFPAASTPRVAVFFVQSHSGQQVKRASVGAEGYVLDVFSREAVANHLAKVGEPLVKAFGANPPYAIFSDSLEAYGSDWTPVLPVEFKKRRGYDLVPHLPELVAGGTPEADKIRHDYGRTLTELVNENYLIQVTDWAKAHHTQFRSQTYGEPAVSFSSQNLVSLAEGEGPQWRAWSTLRWATSANHVFDHNVTSGETFTWLHSPVFRATPLDMKTEADIDFIMGENQLIFHGWPYSPPQAFYPGWSLYAAANFNDNNPWHPVMPDVTRYIARLSYLMRQGQPANQVAILLPTDDVWSTFSPTHTTVTGDMQPRITPLMPSILTAGYNVDFIDADAIDSVGIGTHQILLLPPTDRIPLATLRKIAAWEKTGGKVIAIQKAPSIDPDGKTIPELTALSKQLFDPAKGTLVPDAASLTAALPKLMKPDFEITAGNDVAKTQLGFIRRKLPAADIYFVTNTSPQPIDATATFATTHKTGAAWDPDSTAESAATPTSQAIHLAPYESRVFVFGAPAAARPLANPTNQLADLSSDWKVTFVDDKKSVTEAKLTDWIADDSTKHYSGEAIYAKDFNLASKPTTPVYLAVDGGTALPGAPNSPPEHGPQPGVLGPDGLPNPAITRTGPGMHAYFDPPIKEAALVTVNGQPVGALWHPPYRLDVSKFLKPGANHIEIHVYNTRLNAWSALPPHDFKPLTAKYGDKFQMQDLQLVQPVSSGILGSIHLVTETK